jgi:hypothetical protein
MIESQLKDTLMRIFDFKKATFNMPDSDAQEQECLFIEIQDSKNRMGEAVQKGKISGIIRVFVNSDKMPLGYFAKKIEQAQSSDTKDLFFYEIEQNAGTYQNIVERTTKFIYFFNSQYNPSVGTINQVTIDTEYTE